MHAPGAAEIGRDAGDRRPLDLSRESARRVEHRLFVAAVDDDTRSGRREALGDRVADTRGGAADHRLPAGKIDAHVLSSIASPVGTSPTMGSDMPSICSVERSSVLESVARPTLFGLGKRHERCSNRLCRLRGV